MIEIFNPVPAPICIKCSLPLGFIKLPNGKWRPCNPDGSDHWDLCRDVRYALAMTGQIRTSESLTKAYRRVVTYWDGGIKPFVVEDAMIPLKRRPLPACDNCVPPWEACPNNCASALRK